MWWGWCGGGGGGRVAQLGLGPQHSLAVDPQHGPAAQLSYKIGRAGHASFFFVTASLGDLFSVARPKLPSGLFLQWSKYRRG